MDSALKASAMQKKTGLVHVLTGGGNGKTTSAIGIVVRARGRGLKVAFVQFLKNDVSSELAPMQRMGVEVVGGARYSDRHAREGALKQGGGFMAFSGGSFKADAEDRKLVGEAFGKAMDFASSGGYDLVVLDEIFGAMKAGLVAEADILSILARKAPNCELVLTGRGATPAIEAAADYVTHMEKVKHPFDLGVNSRSGIDY